MRNLQEQLKKAFCYIILFWPFTFWITCSRDVNIFANSWPSASNFKSFSQSVEELGQWLHLLDKPIFIDKLPIFFRNYHRTRSCQSASSCTCPDWLFHSQLAPQFINSTVEPTREIGNRRTWYFFNFEFRLLEKPLIYWVSDTSLLPWNYEFTNLESS